MESQNVKDTVKQIFTEYLNIALLDGIVPCYAC